MILRYKHNIIGLLVSLVLGFVSTTAFAQSYERQGGYVDPGEPDDRSFSPLIDLVADGGFEGGTPNVAWTESSTNFGTPLCDVGGCGLGAGTGPFAGSWWVWFGGIGGVSESGSVEQQVTINPGTAKLSFWTEFPVCETTGTLSVNLDANVLFSTSEADAACNVVGYAQRVVDVSAFADGSTYTLAFTSVTDAGAGPTNFFVDDVMLDLVTLPVELTSFTARMHETGIVLHWTTASEEENLGFEVEQSTNGAEFRQAGFVEGHWTTDRQHDYRFEINDLDPGDYAFRLKQIDADGSFEYSPTIETVVVVPGQIWLSAAYPNPFNPVGTIQFAVPTEQHVRLSLHDATGRTVRVLYDHVAPANSPIHLRIDASDLGSGVYLIRAESLTGVATRPVTVLK